MQTRRMQPLFLHDLSGLCSAPRDRDNPFVSQFAIESNQTMTEIMDELFTICDALPSVGPSQAVVDCDRIPHMPDISFSLPDADLTLSAEQYVLRVSENPRSLTIFRPVRAYLML